MLTYDNIQKIETSQVDDDIIGGLLDYNIDKIQNLARKLSDDKSNIAADLFKAFKKA